MDLIFSFEVVARDRVEKGAMTLEFERKRDMRREKCGEREGEGGMLSQQEIRKR